MKKRRVFHNPGISSETSVDQSIMTGESLPVDKTVGETVFCGTINRFGAVDICASKVGEDSSLQKLIRMVQETEDKKAPIARIADRAASWLVPVALLIAVAAGLVTQDIVRFQWLDCYQEEKCINED